MPSSWRGQSLCEVQYIVNQAIYLNLRTFRKFMAAPISFSTNLMDKLLDVLFSLLGYDLDKLNVCFVPLVLLFNRLIVESIS